MLYVGASKNLKHRIIRHKSNCCRENNEDCNQAVYRHIRENGGWDAFAFHIVEERDDFIDEIDLRKREQYHINRIPKQFSLNENSAYTAPEERKKKMKEYRAMWRKANPEKMPCITRRGLKNPAYMREYMRAQYWRKKELLKKVDKNT
jgi:GIY-YIG catalytic domain.